MPDRTPAATLERYTEPLRRATSCVTPVVFTRPTIRRQPDVLVDVVVGRGDEAPHLHLGPAADIGRAALTTAHLPTGPVGLHQVLRLAIESFEVAPIRQDWDQVLRV